MKKIALLLVSLISLSGCSGLIQNETTASSSLVDFLYPDSDNYREHQPSIPHLSLPVNVGIAFVPSSDFNQVALSEKKKYELLSKVKTKFSDLSYVNRIEIISDKYLQKGGGFDNLKQLSRLYDVQVMALVSYDQVTRSTQNNAALLYWTIAGMYLIPGNENTTQTFVDTAVFDIESTQMLFRAPGLSSVESLSTAVGVEDTFYENSSEGYTDAVTDMIENLHKELDNFKVRVKEENVADVSYKSNYSGSSFSWLTVLGLMLIYLVRRNKKMLSNCSQR
ncbi:rhombotarget lipoprotein [Vibrio coralliilyticus]|uniref:rhombotarget lipoprotein n=1 Tax=Vibrio coralliilyticus TaxID=190893 RepID=UPI000BAC24BD|nr:rhombotarget lipoprotein [Vibrio coralliilyticus]NOI75349.1 rhombotarget lipoprotein [Vibrio coralliilyticus]PAW04179.1 rhombotarget lipoprotein [Vibrio coralliilyticus]